MCNKQCEVSLVHSLLEATRRNLFRESGTRAPVELIVSSYIPAKIISTTKLNSHQFCRFIQGKQLQLVNYGTESFE